MCFTVVTKVCFAAYHWNPDTIDCERLHNSTQHKKEKSLPTILCHMIEICSDFIDVKVKVKIVLGKMTYSVSHKAHAHAIHLQPAGEVGFTAQGTWISPIRQAPHLGWEATPKRKESAPYFSHTLLCT